MRSAIIQPGQTLKDLALQYYGTMEGLVALMDDNGLSFNPLTPGTEILIREPGELAYKAQSNEVVKKELLKKNITLQTRDLGEIRLEPALTLLNDELKLLDDSNLLTL